MDFRDPKVQKLFIGIAAFIVVVYFWYARLFSTYNQKLSDMTQEYSTMITNLKNVEMKSKSLDALKLEYEDLLARYREIEQLLPEVKQIPSFLVQLHTASSLTGTKIIKVEPKPMEPESFYNVAGFEMEMTGTYHDFGKFIGYVANFPFIANVTELQLETTSITGTGTPASGGKADRNKAKATIKAMFTLSTYFVKADERLKELVI
jgi:type IV pilus assembly protein PilO